MKQLQKKKDTSAAKVAKLARELEVARWRVAEKCGWVNSLSGQCKEGEIPTAYPDEVEAFDANVVTAIAKFIAIRQRLKTAKTRLKKLEEVEHAE